MPALVVALVLTYCDDPNRGRRYHGFPPDTRCYVTIQQGVWGNVWFWEGDFMPPGFGTITPVVRAVHAHELTTYDQVDPVGSGCFFRSINRRLVATTYSDSNGFFQMTLPAGCYSFFVREGSQFYANGDDGRYIMPAPVVSDSVAKVQIDINYRACF